MAMTVEKEHIHICDDAADADAGELYMYSKQRWS